VEMRGLLLLEFSAENEGSEVADEAALCSII
jgi:hypothetical protein